MNNVNYLQNKCIILKAIRDVHKKGRMPYISELAFLTGLSPTTIAMHLKKLKSEGVVEIVKGKGGRKYVQIKDGKTWVNGRGRTWTQWELNLLKETYGKISTKTIAEALDRGIDSVRQKANQLGLRIRPVSPTHALPKHLKPLLALAENGGRSL